MLAFLTSLFCAAAWALPPALSVRGLLLPAAAALPRQGGKTPPPKDDPEIPRLLSDLAAVVKDRKGRRDEEGVKILDQLARRFAKLNAKQRKLVIKGFGRVFSAKRKPENPTLFLAAAEALTSCGVEGAKVLAKVADDRRFKDKAWMLFRAQVIRNLGRTKDPRQVKFLLEVAQRDRFDQCRAAAGTALGEFREAPMKLRKEIVGKLIKELNAVYNASKANLDPVDPTRKIYEDRYAAIQDPWMKALAKLTGQSFREPLEWERWFNHNKRKNWDELGWGGPGPKKKGAGRKGRR